MDEDKFDITKVGLKVGLEFHQQLYSPFLVSGLSHKITKLIEKHGGKLFCRCPAWIRESDPDITVLRQLRAIAGETGKVDIAAKFEQKKKQNIIYEAYSDTNCLVELDEEPIQSINLVAVKQTLTIARKLLNMKLIDEIQVCRKTIVDGSNVSGFQRTCLVALGTKDSFIEIDGKKIHIQTVCLEEDSAKNIGTKDGKRVFRLDRLGIPLIEIATGPDMTNPKEVKAFASKIGELLRVTGFVKRGLGTIRQDINVSIEEGTRVEIKGVQQLDLIDSYVHNEALRQYRMLGIITKLKERKLQAKEIKSAKNIDITDYFRDTLNESIAKSIHRGERIYALRLPKFANLLGQELQPDYRLGSEFSYIAKVVGGLGGIFHSDELPKYEITEKIVEQVRNKLDCKEQDGFILIVGETEPIQKTFTIIKEVIICWINHGLPEQVRAPREDGVTTYL
ncbi:MAG: Glu-tRNA(Gln) amidotransferase subunit GatE, partial [Candidatus Heimdallarchaeaceae archaeon]